MASARARSAFPLSMGQDRGFIQSAYQVAVTPHVIEDSSGGRRGRRKWGYRPFENFDSALISIHPSNRRAGLSRCPWPEPRGAPRYGGVGHALAGKAPTAGRHCWCRPPRFPDSFSIAVGQRVTGYVRRACCGSRCGGSVLLSCSRRGRR